jgi:hypothetical protein
VIGASGIDFVRALAWPVAVAIILIVIFWPRRRR